MPYLALLLASIFIAFLFFIDSKSSQKTLPGLWVVLVWCFILLTRDPSYWFGTAAENTATIDTYESGNAFNRNIYIVLILYAIAVLVRRHVDWGDLARRNAAMLVFFSYCFISILWSDFPTVAFKGFFKSVIGNVVMALIILTDPLPLDALKKVMRRATFVVLPLSVICIKYFPAIGRQYNRLGIGSFQGITNDSNALSVACYICGLTILWNVIEKGSKANKAEFRINMLMLLLTYYLLEKGDGATPVVSMLFGALILLLFRFNLGVGKVRAFGRYVGLVMMIAAPVLVMEYAAFLNIITDVLGHSETLWGRYELWTYIVPLVKNPLIGTGYASFWLGSRLQTLWSIYWWRPTEAHNGYLEIYATLGIIGLVLFGIVISVACRKATSANLKQGMEPLRLAYLLPMLLYNLTEAGFRTLHPVWFLFLVAAIETPFIMKAATEASPVSARVATYPGIVRRRAGMGTSAGHASR